MNKFLILIIIFSFSALSADNMSQKYTQSPSQYKQQDVSDQDISSRITNILNSGMFTNAKKNITFDVKNGVVTLKGSVDTPVMQKVIEQRVQNINGVQKVNNQITVNQK